MKRLFERDIPELKDKSCQERRSLYMRARNRNKRILIRSILASVVIYVPLFTSLMEFLKHGYLPSFLSVIMLYSAIGFPLAFLVNEWWIDPLVRNAIQALLAEEGKGPREAKC